MTFSECWNGCPMGLSHAHTVHVVAPDGSWVVSTFIENAPFAPGVA